jgi:hypothetical protein
MNNGRIKRAAWIVISIPLLIVNLIPIGFILLFLFSSPWSPLLLTAFAADYIYIIVALATIDFIGIYNLHRKCPNGLVKTICKICFITPAILLVLSYHGFMDIVRRIPVRVSREEALKHINNCDVYSLENDPHISMIRITFPNGRLVNVNGEYAKEYKIYVIANNDFDFLRNAARSVKDRCGYRLNDEFSPGFEGFEK